MFLKQAQRGQALIEAAVFLPVVLLVLFGIVYFARLGVLSERAQSAVRYGTLISYNSQAYGGADIYNGLGTAGARTACPATVAVDTAGAVTHATAPAGAATPVPLWRPDVAAAATCAISTISTNPGSTNPWQFFTVTNETVVAGITVPPYLAAALGTRTNAQAAMGYLHSDPASVILYCVPAIGSLVAGALKTTYGGGGSC